MAEMKTERKSVLDYLSKNKFLIPMYQRPYAWKQEECEQLWNDIVDFFNDENRKPEDEYFLGSVVMYKQNNRQNIIDGQQRTISLSLLLKALYIKAFKDRSEETKNLVTMLESCLWDIDDISGKADYTAMHLKSDVIIKDEENILEKILTNGYNLDYNEDIEKKIKNSNSNYEKNYLFFILKSDEFAKENPTKWEKLCVVLLKSCILLPIECEGYDEDSRLENALRIFNTLNNRGIPLSDSDIFKGIIFKSKKTLEERREFANKWKKLENKNSMDFIFRNYMHVTRARNKIKTSEIGLRNFFTKEHKKILKDDNTINEIEELCQFWNGDFDDNYTHKSLQLYEVLHCLPNDYWNYLDSAYFMYCKDINKNYFEGHDLFLKKIIANFLVKLINKPTISEIKPIVFNAYVSLYSKEELDFQTDSKQILENEILFKEQFFKANKLIPSLLTLNLYLKYPNQPIFKAEIEHIFPKTTNWRPSYTGWDKEKAEPFIESIGNKMWLEKRLNVKASNGYFDEKKEKYKNSVFLEAQDLAKYSKNDWLKEDIEQRSEEIYKRLKEFFEKNVM
ncbi:DUF262 domain-containing protein [Campylobacter sp. RM9929]|uniref:DUF262 domain-containing protein n=1 Tax=Campylobacter molothri TaxID=1032242 RepID=UPI001E07881F|nr:DUF262 domain-containing protein [Campylobacter sp. W0065]MBZ7948482.1 DUF262 domain-containing protein [Campylobacter sp. RM9929]MBZ7966219.1 DUF262 domain-containing protein [Campylobacter sp. RM10535]